MRGEVRNRWFSGYHRNWGSVIWAYQLSWSPYDLSLDLPVIWALTSPWFEPMISPWFESVASPSFEPVTSPWFEPMISMIWACGLPLIWACDLPVIWACDLPLIWAYDLSMIWACGLPFIWACDLPVIWVCGLPFIWACDLPVIWAYDLSMIWACDLPVIWAYDLSMIWACGIPVIWACDLPAIWACDLPVIWACDLPAIWACDLPVIWACDLPVIWACDLPAIWACDLPAIWALGLAIPPPLCCAAIRPFLLPLTGHCPPLSVTYGTRPPASVWVLCAYQIDCGGVNMTANGGVGTLLYGVYNIGWPPLYRHPNPGRERYDVCVWGGGGSHLGLARLSVSNCNEVVGHQGASSWWCYQGLCRHGDGIRGGVSGLVRQCGTTVGNWLATLGYIHHNWSRYWTSSEFSFGLAWQHC